jgi:hypothetical protein
VPYQIVRIERDAMDGIVAARQTQPLFELEQDALALAEFDALRTGEDCGFDEALNGWWAIDPAGRRMQFVVQPLAAGMAA